MDYTSIFTLMRAEVTLTAILVLVFLYDLVAGERGRRRFSAVVCGLLAVQTAVCLLPGGEGGEVAVRSRAVEKGLGGDAAPVEAGTPHFPRLEESYPQAAFGGIHRGGIPTGAAADDQQIVVHG